MEINLNHTTLTLAEMERVCGGTFVTFRNNLMGLWTGYSLVSKVMATKGYTIAYLASRLQNGVNLGIVWATASLGPIAAQALLIAGGCIGAAALAYGTYSAVKFLWNNRVFY